jgi:hypothetical protein
MTIHRWASTTYDAWYLINCVQCTCSQVRVQEEVEEEGRGRPGSNTCVYEGAEWGRCGGGMKGP